MQSRRQSLIAREDTLLGVCQALGEDFGFNPLPLRIAFAVPLIWFPTLVIGTYLALGAAVLVSRLVAPDPRSRVAHVEAAPPAVAGDNDAGTEGALAAAA